MFPSFAARSKAVVEILLRNPKHSQLLYRPNKQGETPYSIDASQSKTILGQVFFLWEKSVCFAPFEFPPGRRRCLAPAA